MSSPALDSTLPPSNAGVSTALESPIARSGPNGGAAKVEVEDAPLTGSRSSPGNGGGGGVSELLQRALSLKEGSDLDEIKDGERTPGQLRASAFRATRWTLRLTKRKDVVLREPLACVDRPDRCRSTPSVACGSGFETRAFRVRLPSRRSAVLGTQDGDGCEPSALDLSLFRSPCDAVRSRLTNRCASREAER